MRTAIHPSRRAFALCACLALLPTVGLSETTRGTEATPDPRADGLEGAERVRALLDRVREEQASIRSLTAEFVQRKESELLLQPEESRGHFAFERPDHVLWEYEAPDPMHVLVDGSTMLTWYEGLDRAELVEVGRFSDRILEYMGATNSIDLLERYFNVTVTFPGDPEDPYRLELSPRSRRVEKRLAGMTVWLDPKRYVPVRLVYLEADGDRTEYEFHDLRVNPEIPAGRFDLKLPDGVDVRRVTLDGG